MKDSIDDWRYKGSIAKSEKLKNLKSIKKKLFTKLSSYTILLPEENIKNDDELDAYMSWVLCYLFVHRSDVVEFVGNEKKHYY